jgi:thiamine biosynthesis lipoprotein
LDFGDAGFCYLVVNIGDVVEKAGVDSYTLNAGGDILHRSSSGEALVAGMENPLDTSEAIGTIHFSNQSLCASAGSKRAWGEYHHIIDPDELTSPTEVIATWVLADDTMTADGLATALFFTDPEQLRQHFSFSYAMLSKDMRLAHSTNFPLTVFTAD